MENYLDGFIEELLHINDVGKNKLLNILPSSYAEKDRIYTLYNNKVDNICEYTLGVIKNRIGKVANTVLKGSALASCDEQIIGQSLNIFEWQNAVGERNAQSLNDFISDVYKEISLRGNNPLFLSVGAVRWKVAKTRTDIVEVLSPLLIFPIRLVRSGNTSPVSIEFIDDEIYFNPCLYHKMRQVLGEEVAGAFPHPNGICDFDTPIELDKLGDVGEYFARVAEYMDSCKRNSMSENVVFELVKDSVTVAQYKHDELAMYYDIKRNRDKIYSHPLVERVFKDDMPYNPSIRNVSPDYVLPRDSYQQDIIERVVGGESLIIKGPPGTGKTQTISNMIASLLSDNKKVLLASKKLSALAEVRNKLPEELRKFVMLLDYETESQVAKVNPSAIKADFKQLLSKRREYNEDRESYMTKAQGNSELLDATRFLATYSDDMFRDADVAGRTCYDAMDTVLAYDMPAVDFASPEAVRSLSADRYVALLSAVKDAGVQYDMLTGNGAHSVQKNPWFALKKGVDTEAAYNSYKSLGQLAELVITQLDSLQLSVDISDKPYLDALTIMLSRFDRETITAVLNNADKVPSADIRKALEKYMNAHADVDGAICTISNADNMDSILAAMTTLSIDGSLDIDTLIKLYIDISVFYPQGKLLEEKKLADIQKLFDKVESLKEERVHHQSAVYNVFLSDGVDSNAELLCDAAEAFEKYTAQSDKPNALDIRAKNIYKKLQPLCYRKVTFGEVVQAVAEYMQCSNIDREIEALMYNNLRLLLQGVPTDSQIACMTEVFRRAQNRGVSARQYIDEIKRGYPQVADCMMSIGVCGKYTLEEIRKGYIKEAYRYKLENTVSLCLTEIGVKPKLADMCNPMQLCNIASGLMALVRMYGDIDALSLEERVDTVDKIIQSGHLVGPLIMLVDGLSEFGLKFFSNYYTAIEGVTWRDMGIFATESGDRDMLSAANRYREILSDENLPLDLRKFFAAFESGEIAKVADFDVMFEHSVYALALQSKLSRVHFDRNGIGRQVAYNLDKYGIAERKVYEGNAHAIEAKCMQHIDADDSDFSFLNAERNPSENLRKMFKKYARAILKLKKCMILSPSTVSVLFGTEEYEDFDVVIIDEASQLEPVYLLPILFRAKQCVIVGDEWQMPPIQHFRSRYEASDDEIEDNEALEPDLSALTVALRHSAFDVKQLICHYRSKTESLITFSQRRFYPYMRTFPVPEPKTADLGINDIYVADGVCADGKNVREATAVVAEIRRHFERYFDEKADILSMPFGVVAFGESQLECIRSMIESDRELSDKIARALSKYDDVPEKLIFYKTIETVQGQETGHLILSLTYGKVRNYRGEIKVVQAFGQLNRDSLGECIFNVAVTRAKNRVTVIHSVLPSDITSERISYIRRYLEVAEQFSHYEKGQFVSSGAKRGFLTSVADAIEACGIDRNRIVFNYGVTDGSVRIPIVILSEDMQTAQLGIWCERGLDKKYNYIDYNVRYYDILKSGGWNLHRIYIHDWLYNADAEKKLLADKIKMYL